MGPWALLGDPVRTAEALGIQHVWCVDPTSFERDEERRSAKKRSAQWAEDASELREHVAFARDATKWLSVRDFATTAELLAALRADGYAATSLPPHFSGHCWFGRSGLSLCELTAAGPPACERTVAKRG